MTEHVLKALATYWDAIERGDKTFEVRRDDRGFQRGDVLVLQYLREGAYWPDASKVLRRRVTYCSTIAPVATAGTGPIICTPDDTAKRYIDQQVQFLQEEIAQLRERLKKHGP